MDIAVRKIGEVTVLDINGKMVLGYETELTQKVSELLAAGSRYFAINLAGVPMMDSSGIGSVVRAHSSVIRAGGKPRYFGANKLLLQTLKMVRLDSLLELCDDEPSALARFQS